MAKPGYTLEQHERLGKELQAIRDRLVTIQVELSHAYPIKLAGLVGIASDAVDKLRLVLDEQVCREHQGSSESLKIYLRKPHEGCKRCDT
jgi:hypothetical protein